MTTLARPSPLTATTVVERDDPDRVVTATVVDAGEPVLAGHYPGFAIVPGVCLIECAHRSVLAAGGGVELAAIEAARFLSPVFPGDRVVAEVARRHGDQSRWSAVVSTERGTAAEVRLRYVVTS